MATLTSADEFLQAVQRSGLVERPRLDAYLAQSPADASDATNLAARLVRDGLLTPFQARQLLAGKTQGFSILGKYKIMDLLGSGGMGKVYLCEHMLLRRLVAVKVLPQAKTINASAVERFYREARAVAALDHPNIVRCFDVDRDGAVHFMVMEYVDGVGLDHLVRDNGPLSPLRGAHYIRQAALGLQHAHEAGWVHRDIKPGNILVDRTGVIKLLDLGLARLFSDVADNLTAQFSERAVLGTADYISPEQAVASHDVDIRADIYSLGCTFFFLLTGRALFADGTLAQKLIWHQSRTPQSLTQLRPEVPAGLAAVVDRMLAKDPAQRHQTPIAVAEALGPWTETPIPPPSDREMPRQEAITPGSLADSRVLDSDLWNPPPFSIGTLSRWKVEPPPPGQTVNVRKSSTPPPPTGPAPSSASSVPVSPFDSKATIRKMRPPPAGPLDTVRKMTTPSGGPLSTMRDVRVSPPAQPPVPVPPPATNHKKARNRGILLGIVAVLAIAGVAAKSFLLPSRPGPTQASAAVTTTEATKPTAPGGPEPLVVTRNRFSEAWGRPNTCEWLAQALARARAGDRIVLLDANLEEQLNLDGAKETLARNITITSNRPAGDPTVWRRPSDRPTLAPLLRLNQVEGLTVTGAIVLDGEGELDHLIDVQGRCPGMCFEGLKLTGFRRAAVRFKEAFGTASAPMTLKSVRLTRLDAEAALLIAAGTSTEGTSHLQVSECRFEGPMESAVQIDGALSHTQFRHNRFFRCGSAFKTTAATPLQLDVTGNTCYDIRSLFQFTEVPALKGPMEASQIVLSANLIARTPMLVRTEGRVAVEKWKPLFSRCEHNVRDRDSAKDSVPFLAMKEMSFELPTNPTDEHFLLYPPSNDLASAGPDRTPVGVPPR